MYGIRSTVATSDTVDAYNDVVIVRPHHICGIDVACCYRRLVIARSVCVSVCVCLLVMAVSPA